MSQATAPGEAALAGALTGAVADELVLLNEALAELMDGLGQDPAVLRRHMTGLQAIDRVSQVQLALAEVLRSSEPVATRLAAVPLDAVAERLRAKTAERAVAAGFA